MGSTHSALVIFSANRIAEASRLHSELFAGRLQLPLRAGTGDWSPLPWGPDESCVPDGLVGLMLKAPW